MRGSLITLCTLSTWALQNCSVTAQAQPYSDSRSEDETTVVKRITATVNKPGTAIPSLAPPEVLNQFLFSVERSSTEAHVQSADRVHQVTQDAAIAAEPSLLDALISNAVPDPVNPATTDRPVPPPESTANLTDLGCPDDDVDLIVIPTKNQDDSAPSLLSPSAFFVGSVADNRAIACVAQSDMSTPIPSSFPVISDSSDQEESLSSPHENTNSGRNNPIIPPGVPTYRVPESEFLQDLHRESEAELNEEHSPDQLGDDPAMNMTNPGLDETGRLTPLERQPTRLFNLETANQLRDNTLQITTGFHQTLVNDSPQAGTGGQLYYGTVDWGVTDDLQFGVAVQYFDDPPSRAIDGEFPDITLGAIAPNIQYRVIDQSQFDLGVQGSVELFSFESSLFNTDDGNGDQLIGSLHVPMTYTVSPELQLHLTPAVAFYPDRVNDTEFYGTLFSVGTGVSWQPSERFTLYGTLNLPLGPGGNAISSNDQAIERQILWTVGSRYNVTPKVGVDLYVTNGLGVTPATGILASLPEGNDPSLGLRLNYTPDLGSGYRSSYRANDQAGAADALSVRDRQLLLDGFTLSSPHTVQPGSVLVSAGGGTSDRFHVSAAYSPDEDLQVEGLIEEFSSDSDLITEGMAGDNVKYAVGAQLRLLNQRQGDPFSLGVRILGGRDMDEDRQIGTLFADLPLSYEVNNRTALFANPRFAAFSDEEVFGLGLGINHEVLKGLQLIGEVTPVIDESVVWAVGTRYSVPQTSISLDVYASNAAGRNGLGTLVGESGANVGFNINWLVGDR